MMQSAIDGTQALARILVVDDDDLVRKLLVRILTRAGHTCVGAANAPEARRLLAESDAFEVLISDVNMPGESGLELVREALETHRDVAVVMITGADDPDLATTALELGAYGYVLKPFKTSELLINVANALRRRSLEMAARNRREDLEAMLLDRTAALRRSAAQHQVVATFSQRALYGIELHMLYEDAMRMTREELGVDLALILEQRSDRRELVVIAASGCEHDITGLALDAEDAGDAAQALSRRVVTGDVDATSAAHQVGDSEAKAGLAVRIPLRTGAFGVLAVYSRTPREFTADDTSFAQSLANVLGHTVGRRSIEEQMHHQALHDPLTGLPNRSLLADRLEHALARRRRRKGSLALLFIDLDHFKTVNDSLGHRVGDDLLVAVAHRLTPLARTDDTLARFGGDEFVLLCEDLQRMETAGEIAERIGRSLEEPFHLGDDAVFVTASIGIAMPTHEQTSGESLIRDADAAMYRAKDQGRSRYELFDAALRQTVVERMHTETSLRWALERDELRVHYQPLIGLEGGALVGFEALVRWQHPERGLLPPGAFIPHAERSALIVAIGEFVLRRACQQLTEWSAETDDRSLSMSVNVAARQLGDPHFGDLVARVLEETGLAPERLRLEITERSLVEETAASTDMIACLKQLGVQLVLDDFGTGYSALGYIQRFPLNSIKLDRSFIRRLADDETQRTLVGGIVSIAHALGLTTVAEGIETEAQADAARGLGCDLAQGYLFARPEDAETATRLVVASRNGSRRLRS